MALILPNDIEADTSADAVELQQNFDTLENFINTEVILRDGQVAMTAPLLLAGNPTSTNHAANKSYVDARVAKAGDTMTGNLWVGISNPNPDLNQDGSLVSTAGQLRATAKSATTHPLLQLMRTNQVAGDQWAVFQRWSTSAGTGATLGSITQVGTSGTAYNTTSDKRLKTLIGSVDPDQALAKIAATEPVNFTFTDHPEDGEQVGFFAQDLAVHAPEAVTPGKGDPGDADFVPWMVDLAKLVPTLVAAVQALAARVAALEAA